MLIRRANLEDAGLIASFNAAMASETEGLALDRDRLIAGVRALISDPHKGFYLLAEIDGQARGQLMITHEWSDWRNGTFWWIQSVYVDPDFRKRGVYKTLYRHLEKLAHEQDCCGIRLYFERGNERARRVYEKLGMSATVYEMYEVDFVIGRHG